jgi:S1-C subfamily serine protease
MMKHIVAVAALLATGLLVPLASAEDIGQSLDLYRPMHLWGTGFIVDRQGHVLTADHVTRGCAEVTLLHEGTRVRATVAASDESDDLSLLSSAVPLGAPVAFAGNEGVTQGSLVLIADYAQAASWSEEGARPRMLFNGMIMAEPKAHSTAQRLYIVSDARPGSSGSPVFDSNGFVAAVVTAKITWRGGTMPLGQPSDVRLATSGLVAKEFLHSNRIDYVEDGAGWARPRLRGGDLAVRSELRVECRG